MSVSVLHLVSCLLNHTAKDGVSAISKMFESNMLQCRQIISGMREKRMFHEIIKTQRMFKLFKLAYFECTYSQIV